MERQRVRLIVEANLDLVPGWGFSPQDWVNLVQRYLDETVRHYHPTVTVDVPTTED